MTDDRLSLARDEKTGVLTAVFRAEPGLSAPEREDVMALLQAQGWAGAAMDDHALLAFCVKCRQALDALAKARAAAAEAASVEAGAQAASPEAGAVPDASGAGAAAAAVDVQAVRAPATPSASAPEAPVEVREQVGQVLDAACRVRISADNMMALLDISPAQGGCALTIDDVRVAAQQAGVAIALDEEALAAAVAQGRAAGVVVATGLAPQRGTAAVFESLLDGLRPKPPEADDNTRVDFRTLGTLLIVSPGQALMRRIPAQQGWPGTNVRGQPVPVPHVPDADYARNLSGVVFDEADPNVLRAAIAGSPVEVKHGVNVNAVIEIDNVDLSTGNITFDGALRVRGDVKGGMAVHVTGDVIVHGTVEAAEIRAGGNVTVEGGIIGALEAPDTAPGGEARQIRIVSKGTVQSRFINHAHVSAGLDVVVAVEILNSEVLAGGSITVGAPGASRGGIVGGRCCAMTLVRAPRLGAPGGVATHVQVGLDPHADSRRAEIEASRQRLKDERAKLEQILAFLAANPAKAAGGLGERARGTYLSIQKDMAGLDAEEAQIATDTMRTEGVLIEAGQRLCNGVTLQIANRRKSVMDDFGRIRALWHEDDILLSSY